LPKRLRGELRARGLIETTGVHELQLAGASDPNVLAALRALDHPTVLVTNDNKLPVEHADEIRDGPVAVAVVDSSVRPEDLTVDQYRREVVHRHAHRFVEQEAGTVFRYRATARRIRVTLE
jgi:hypothetical protein